MIAIKSDYGNLMERLEDLLKSMPSAHPCIIRTRRWHEPWALGASTTISVASTAYKEASIATGCCDEEDFDDDWDINCEYDSYMLVIKKDNNFGIVAITQDEEELMETAERLIEHLMLKIYLPSPVIHSQSTDIKVSKMKLFK